MSGQSIIQFASVGGSRISPLINGNFSIAQLGTAFTLPIGNTGIAHLDRWIWSQYTDGGVAAIGTISQIPCFGQTEVPGNPRYFCRITNTTAGSALGVNSYTAIVQSLESVETLAGETVTISFYARSSIPNKTVVLEALQTFGVGGSPYTTITKGFTLTPNFQRYSATLLIPAIGGKVLGTSLDDHLQIALFTQGGSALSTRLGNAGFGWEGTGNIDLANFQIDPGNQAAPCQPSIAGVELQRCLRYSWKANGEMLGITRDGYNLFSWGQLTFPVPMRVAPTLINGLLIPDSGSSGAPILIYPTPYSTGIYNLSGNFTIGTGVRFTGWFNAGL